MVTVTWDCGASSPVNADKVHGKPPCPAHGADCRVFRVKAPNPRITGHGSGPLMHSKFLEPVKVNLAPEGPLKLKPRKDGERKERDDV